jgi:protein disulfide-isomerase A1
MKYAFGLAALAALATASDVHDLTKDTFDGFVKENDLVLAECKSRAIRDRRHKNQC